MTTTRTWLLIGIGALLGPIIGIIFVASGLFPKVPIDSVFILINLAFGIAVIGPLLWGMALSLKKQAGNRRTEKNPDDLLVNIFRLQGGTLLFMFKGVPFQGIIDYVEQVPLGPGAFNVQLTSRHPVSGNSTVSDAPLWFTISLFMANVTNRPGELIIKQPVAERQGFGDTFTFRVKEEDRGTD